MKKRFLENFVSEDRYSPIQGFIWHKKDVHILEMTYISSVYRT